MFETRWPIAVTELAMTADHRQIDYDAVWSGLRGEFVPPGVPEIAAQD
jgi:homogentisate 1,2-dioxygenase